MPTKTLVVTIIMLLVGLILFGALVEQAAWQIHGSTIYNESITFTTNNTNYQTDRSPINTITIIYNDTAGSCTIPSDRYTFDAITGIKIYSNSTIAQSCPNATAGDTYVATYTIVKPSGFASVIMALLIGILAIVIVLIYLGKT